MNTDPDSDRELSLTRIIDATPEQLFRAWTEAELIKQWFSPKPVRTTHAEVDLRPGGASLVVMETPDGNRIECPGIYLEVVHNEKLVATDAYTSAWVPSDKPFLTTIITFEDIGSGQTRYTARALHWSVEDRKRHEQMGFYDGWGTATDQLAELAATL